MRIRVRTLWLALALIMLSHSPVLAQAGEEAFTKEQALAEAKSYQRSCETDPVYSKKFHCDCLAAELYAARLDGDTYDASNVLNRVLKKCVNIEDTAGNAYKSCQVMTSSDSKARKDEYCRCYANAYAKIFAARPVDHPYAYQKQMSLAKGQCLTLKPPVP
jgi:hypothetical protein